MDYGVKVKLVLAFIFIVVVIGIATYLLFTGLDQDYRSLILLVLIFNAGLLLWSSNYVVGYILFPFSNYYMKWHYHMALNRSMINEINRNFLRANTIL